MEEIKITKTSKPYGVKKGETFKVKRNIMYDCVIVRPEAVNLIMAESTARRLGVLTGVPEVAFN